QVQLFQNVVDTVCTERYTYAGQVFQPEHTGQVVVPAAAADTPHSYLICLYLKDAAGIVVEPTRQRDVYFDDFFQKLSFTEPGQIGENLFSFGNAGHSGG